MNLSLGEYRALVAKAFRGAGYSWGLTEEAAFAAKRLAECGLDTAEIVTELLTQVDGKKTISVMPDNGWAATSGILCPVCVGTSIADLGGCETLSLGPTVAPLLIAPFLMSTLASKTTTGYVIEWADGSCEVTRQGLRLHGQRSVGAVPTLIIGTELQLPPASTFSRVDLASDMLETLERFAHRTYAPATEQSRDSGAG